MCASCTTLRRRGRHPPNDARIIYMHQRQAGSRLLMKRLCTRARSHTKTPDVRDCLNVMYDVQKRVVTCCMHIHGRECVCVLVLSSDYARVRNVCVVSRSQALTLAVMYSLCVHTTDYHLPSGRKCFHTRFALSLPVCRKYMPKLEPSAPARRCSRDTCSTQEDIHTYRAHTHTNTSSMCEITHIYQQTGRKSSTPGVGNFCYFKPFARK